MASAAPSLAGVMRKVRAQSSKRRLALQPFFADFDRLHSGRITAAQFARVLNSNDMQLNDEELHVLIAAFTPPIAAVDATAAASVQLRENPAVLYMDFLHALQAAPGGTAAVRRSSASATLSPAEQARLEPESRALQRAIRTRGASLVGPFRDLDPLRTGRVTSAQFRRCLPFATSLTEAAMDLFVKEYGDGRGGVYYMAWCRAMDPALSEKEEQADAEVSGSSHRFAAPSATRNVFSHSVSAGLSRDNFVNASLSAEQLIAVFRQQCALYRIRFEEILHDMDKMRTGRVSAAQFASALGRMPLVHFALVQENIDTLALHYSNGCSGPVAGCHVDYRSFLRDIQPSQVTQTLADGSESAVNFFVTSHAADTFLTSDRDSERAAVLLDRLRAIIRANRISLSPVLRDFDRVRKGIYEHRTCTHTRFARGLATQSIVLPPDDLLLLIRKYTVPSPDGSPSSEVNYYQFVQDVDPSQASGGGGAAAATATAKRPGSHAVTFGATSTRSTRRAPNSPPPSPAAVATDEALRHVAQQVVSRRLNISTVLEEADPMRSGTVSSDRLGAVLGLAGVELRAAELAAMKAAFASSRVSGGVDTVTLQAAVQAAVAELRQRIHDVHNGATTPSMSTAAASATAIHPSTQRLLDRVRHNVQAHNAMLTPFFADFDRHHRGVVTRQQFAQACVRHHLPLSGEELTTLAAAYTVDAAHQDEVRYLDFIRDVGCGEEGRTGAAQAVAAAEAAAGGSMTKTNNATTTKTMTTTTSAAPPDAADLDALLTRLCLFLQERRPRLNEFFPDGDELRHQHVSPSRFRHCLSMLGFTALTEDELQTLEGGFASVKAPGEVDYPAFVCTLRAMLADGVGVAAVTQRRLGSGRTTQAATAVREASAAGLFASATLQRVQHMLRARRTATITAFREYDRTRRGMVTDGQFFACLQALGVSLQPDEASALLRLYGVGSGQVHYLPFAQEVDDAALVSVS